MSESIAFPECAAHADHHNAFSTIDRRNASPAESVSIPDCAPTQLAFSKYGDYLLLLFPLDSRPTISLLWRKADPSIQGSARDEWEGTCRPILAMPLSPLNGHIARRSKRNQVEFSSVEETSLDRWTAVGMLMLVLWVGSGTRLCAL